MIEKECKCQERREVYHIVENFIKENEIRCPEMIYDCDYIIQNAYKFIQNLCEKVGYFDGGLAERWSNKLNEMFDSEVSP